MAWNHLKSSTNHLNIIFLQHFFRKNFFFQNFKDFFFFAIYKYELFETSDIYKQTNNTQKTEFEM